MSISPSMIAFRYCRFTPRPARCFADLRHYAF
jgi:hypothetical protein